MLRYSEDVFYRPLAHEQLHFCVSVFTTVGWLALVNLIVIVLMISRVNIQSQAIVSIADGSLWQHPHVAINS